MVFIFLFAISNILFSKQIYWESNYFYYHKIATLMFFKKRISNFCLSFTCISFISWFIFIQHPFLFCPILCYFFSPFFAAISLLLFYFFHPFVISHTIISVSDVFFCVFAQCLLFVLMVCCCCCRCVFLPSSSFGSRAVSTTQQQHQLTKQLIVPFGHTVIPTRLHSLLHIACTCRQTHSHSHTRTEGSTNKKKITNLTTESVLFSLSFGASRRGAMAKCGGGVVGIFIYWKCRSCVVGFVFVGDAVVGVCFFHRVCCCYCCFLGLNFMKCGKQKFPLKEDDWRAKRMRRKIQ